MAQGRTFEDVQRARTLYDQGLSCNAIAKELGVAASTISGWAKREGLSFNQAKTEDAVAAAKITRAARRGAIIDRLYARTESILDRLESGEYMHRMPSGEGISTFYDEHPPASDERSLSSSIHSYLRDAADLELTDDSNGLAPVESMLGRLAERFGLVESTDA
ncbi:helix-turn-helix domain-containing protein [Agromyces atrinae]|uniref:helix-turn-helix domain-containing protein n=1 Tax=Agromyces atrinae TaxID=592376 RepID=UPI001F5A370A|nr:helix-turn-helix domain-containing protein [Agromyces atrinae]MCI2959537.1 helix-turn-helix domain-containing protein [Agromyces atrinae]